MSDDVGSKILNDYLPTPLKAAETLGVTDGENMAPQAPTPPPSPQVHATVAQTQGSSDQMRNVPSIDQRQLPFTLEVVTEDSNLLLQVYYGVSSSTQTIFDSGAQHINPLSSVPTINGGFLVGDPVDPDGVGIGQIPLLPNKTYGVWVSTARSYIDSSDSPLDAQGALEGLQLFTFSPSPPQVFTSETRTDASDYSDLIADDRGLGYVYLGKVAIAGNGDVEITQYQQSDIVWPCIAYPLSIAP